MVKDKKKPSKKDWVHISIILAIVFILMIIYFIDWDKFTWGLSSEMKEKLDIYEDRLYECSLQISNKDYSNDLTELRNKLSGCKEIVNEARVQINAWDREKNSDEIRSAKLDCDSALKFFEAFFLLINIQEKEFESSKEAVNKLTLASSLLEQSLDKIEKIEISYSNTEYYERYYLSRQEEVEEGKKQINDLKNQIDETLNYYNNLECPSGYVLTDNYECAQQCGSANEYCETGQCCNNKCVSCPSGYYLMTNCECYPI